MQDKRKSILVLQWDRRRAAKDQSGPAPRPDSAKPGKLLIRTAPEKLLLRKEHREGQTAIRLPKREENRPRITPLQYLLQEHRGSRKQEEHRPNLLIDLEKRRYYLHGIHQISFLLRFELIS